MHKTATTLLLTLFPLTVVCGQEAVTQQAVSDLSPEHQAEHDLLSLAENFQGADSLQQMKVLLQSGTNANVVDSHGNTPLLWMCTSIEMDYRYRHDEHYAKAVDAAFAELLRHGADAMKENNHGCNALFYLQSKPELIRKLQQENLLPKELSMRIPYDTLALMRYMKLRVNQASYTTHEECLQYLSRKYCAPAYDRVEQKLDEYLNSEHKNRIPEGAIEHGLAFLRLADPARAEAYVNNLNYWQHSEHFIEEIPATVLATLHRLQWSVDVQKLNVAIRRLQTQLPAEGEDMISCNAARPMVHILEMLYRQDGDNTLPLVKEYSVCRDPELSYYAYRILLHRENLPAPEPAEFEERFASLGKPEQWPAPLLRVYECARVDEAMRKGSTDDISADELQRVEKQLRSMQLHSHADAIAKLFTQGERTNDIYTKQAAHRRYQELVAPAPRPSMAKYILEHPELFSQADNKR